MRLNINFAQILTVVLGTVLATVAVAQLRKVRGFDDLLGRD